MSINVEIKQKGFLKKELPFEVIIEDKLGYGAFDGLKLIPNEINDDEFIAYLPDYLGRGFSVVWNLRNKNNVSLRILTPTSAEELKEFYNCIKRISDYWNCTIKVDGTTINIDDFMNTYDEMIEFNINSLNDVTKEIIKEKSELSMLCVMWPLALGEKEALMFSETKTLDEFRDYMDSMQRVEAFYAKPKFYEIPDGIVGNYFFTLDTKSIFPKEPYVPYGAINMYTNKPYEVTSWQVIIQINADESFEDEDNIIAEISYDSFINAIPKDKKSYYDAMNVLIEGLTIDEIKEMVKN